MSNHFTGLSLGPPLGDQRLDLCDLYAFQSPTDKNRTVIILNANPNADALHPDAIYRVNIDTDGDYLTDIAFSYVFSQAAERPPDLQRLHGHRARSRARPKRWGRRSSPTARSPSAPSPTSSGPAPTLFSPAAAATRSFSTSTESRTCSTSGANGISPSLISAASRHGRASIRIRQRMCFRPRSSCRRVNSIPSPRSMSGGGAA